MKKTIALIISIILVVAIFASCAPAPKDVATTDEETEADAIEKEESASPEPNIEMGFYFKGKDGNPDFSKKIDVGTIVPKNSELALFDANKQYVRFLVYDGSSHMRLQFGAWYGSGNTEYRVYKIWTQGNGWLEICLVRN